LGASGAYSLLAAWQPSLESRWAATALPECGVRSGFYFSARKPPGVTPSALSLRALDHDGCVLDEKERRDAKAAASYQTDKLRSYAVGRHLEIIDRSHKGECGQLAYAWDRHQPAADRGGPCHTSDIRVDRGDRTHHSGARPISPRTATERPATPSLATARFAV
jgi:hypothetical protein